MKKVQISQFDSLFQSLSKDKTKCVFIFMTSQKQNGKYDCKYCQKIAPYLPEIEAQATKRNLPLYIMDVGTLDDWKNEEHPYKSNTMLKVKSVPTMGVFDGQKLTTTLDSGEIVQYQQRKLMFQFVHK